MLSTLFGRIVELRAGSSVQREPSRARLCEGSAFPWVVIAASHEHQGLRPRGVPARRSRHAFAVAGSCVPPVETWEGAPRPPSVLEGPLWDPWADARRRRTTSCIR